MKHSILPTLVVLAISGCATPDQLRQTEAQSAEQGYAVKAMRSEVENNTAAIEGVREELAKARADLKRTQDSMRAAEVAATDARTRSEAAKVQADSALSTSKQFLNNLVAAREEQRRQLDENGAKFAELRRKGAELESRLQTHQRVSEQGAAALSEILRRLGAVETGLQEVSERVVQQGAAMEARAKAGQDSDEGLARQLSALGKQVADTRSVISSEGLLQMMRELEDSRRTTAALRGLVEELQKAQSDSAAQLRKFYLDLDTRMRAIKQNVSQQSVKPEPSTSTPPDPVPLDPPVSQ